MVEGLILGKTLHNVKALHHAFLLRLNRRLKKAEQQVSSIAFDPGLNPETGLGRTAPAFAQSLSKRSLMQWLLKMIGITMGSLPFSGASLASIATDDKIRSASGKYSVEQRKVDEGRSSKASFDA